MKIWIFVIIVFSSALSIDKYSLIDEYKNGNYKNVCKMGKHFYTGNSNDEKLLTIIGDACLRVDYINPLGDIIKKLVSTPEFRENASYFATILLQKKFIYQFMNDNIDLKNLKLPRTSHVLSVVFENLVKNNYKIIDKFSKTIEIKLKDIRYIIWLSNDFPKKVYIDEFKADKLLKRHWYL